ncbi:hypothetical protein [Roseovarius sp. ZX-A-9]|uniref:hypothetical protein n=1 Tax=Roseovarius sp. ZX-A-9 TaxID=3014783 RepID=UPI00232D8FFD|nr:hypothetical protein [Roseovarius sp. ZX-A-9]
MAIPREDIVTAPHWTYTAAAKSADGVTGGYEVQVAQISAKFGAGVFASLDVPA